MDTDLLSRPASRTPQATCPMASPGNGSAGEGVLVFHRHPDGRLELASSWPDSDEQGPFGLRPVEHLATALAGCLSEFAGRFLERRNLPTAMRIDIDWKVSIQHCAIEHMNVTLHIATPLDEMARQTLRRMLDLCPVHKVLQGNVEVGVEVVESKVEG
ncbi:hypothetical protein B1C78_02975 [Thioalkalivibrio denitrificans]|uniref:Osmotically inducible protein OsmC n=1 Tax=Thioalkalivibrio denitrificans TaxID=108003 RepID=A0A1V3NRF6_9GAMM|nr:OsmC family protein [Thioalkalivibrio denitrificans]OOG27631.1 hypothetical protein B1C78_02975 [Thioalkalivibrio denitrificans]